MIELKKLLSKLIKQQEYRRFILTAGTIDNNYVQIMSHHSFWVQRIGNIVIINVDINKKAVACPNVTPIYTLPYGYRPNHAILDNISPQDNDGKPMMIFIQTSGAFNIFTPNTAVGRLTGSIVYCTNDDYPTT